MRTSWSLALATVLFVVTPACVFADPADDHPHTTPERFGTVHFPTSCRADLGTAFDRGIALLHSFAYGEAAKAFEAIAAQDSDCAMAHWGVAMSYFHPMWGPSTPAEMAAGAQGGATRGGARSDGDSARA
jgi:hypothetical protein